MTPIKEIWVILDSVFCLDYADQLSPMAVCPDQASARQTGILLGKHHKKPVSQFSVKAGSMLTIEGGAR